MDKMLLERLAEHQQTIRGIAERALPYLHEQVQPDSMALSRLRWELVRAMTAYQQFKHREIFDPAISRGTGHLRAAAGALKEDCVALGREFTGFVQHWSSIGTADRWPEYRHAALDMNTRLRRHVEREGQTIASLFRGARANGSTVWPVRSR